MTEKIPCRHLARAILLCTGLATLPGCGLVELLASGASDGTKYVIRKVEEQGRGRQARPAGTTPAVEEPAPGGNAPGARPAQATPPAQTPAATAAPVIPVTRGEPLD